MGIPGSALHNCRPMPAGGCYPQWQTEIDGGNNHESKQSIVGKGRLHRDCRLHASIRRSGRSVASGSSRRCGFWTWAAETAPRRFRLARMGAEVVGIDIARNLVEAGNRRAAEAGLDRLKFQEGDACNLEGVDDHSFDLTLSVFGAMFAPKPFDVAKEMVRVTKPGGRIVMGNWIPNDPTFVSQVLKISSAFTPPPPEGFVSPMTWGVDTHIIERFGQAGVPRRRSPWSRTRTTSPRPIRARTQFIDLFRTILWPDDERLRSGRKERQSGGTPRPACGTGESAEQERRTAAPSSPLRSCA